MPHFSGGVLSGNVRVNGLDPVAAKPQVMSRHVGFVLRSRSGSSPDRVEDEIAFALENAAMPPRRCACASKRRWICWTWSRCVTRPGHPLRRRRAMAIARAARTPRRAGAGRAHVPARSQVGRGRAQRAGASHQDLGLTVILAEHRLERVLPFVDTVVYLPQTGAPQAGRPQPSWPRPTWRRRWLVKRLLDWTPVPLTIKDGLRFSRRMEIPPEQPRQSRRRHRMRRSCNVDDITVDYAAQRALDGVSVDVRRRSAGRHGAQRLRQRNALLRSMVGVCAPSTAKFTLLGASIAGRGWPISCREVGYLPGSQRAALRRTDAGRAGDHAAQPVDAAQARRRCSLGTARTGSGAQGPERIPGSQR
ncbi:MAG: hypothetical protein R3A10_11670 [Caldilineaceae bacterium]